MKTGGASAQAPPVHRCFGRFGRPHHRPLRIYASSNAPASYGEVPRGSKTAIESVWAFIDANFLPLGLATALVAGYCFPGQAVAATDANIGVWATTIIFVASGLQMRRGEAAQALKQGRMFVFGLLAILFATPLVGYLVLKSPLQPLEFSVGLAVFCCMPTSLSANIALAGTVGANTAMSILLTSTSNIIAVFTMPFVVSRLLASGSLSLDAGEMTIRLVKSVLLPLLIGATLRSVQQVRQAIDARKKLVRNLSTLCLACVPFAQIGTAKAQGSLAQLTPSTFGALGSAILAALLVIRACNLAVFCSFCKHGCGVGGPVPKEITRAIILAASQKTLPISIAVLMQLGNVLGAGVGLATLPCVLAHFTQVLLDSALVRWWQARDAAADKQVAPESSMR